ncbi:MAG: PEP-CTERM sorting domain-containing protein [Gemmatimonadales bacterium]|nr:PEP-CTERM sorting domain-containing protein [Gemmatimonadales bacterium]
MPHTAQVWLLRAKGVADGARAAAPPSPPRSPPTSRIRPLAGALVALALVAAPADAQVISLNTGVDAGGNLLASQALDPFWTISLYGGATFTAARVAAPGHPIICCGMESAPNTARWISDPSIQLTGTGTSWGVGRTVYARRTFDLSGYTLSSVSLDLAWRVADVRWGVYLNGVLLPSSQIGNFGFSFGEQLQATSGFNQGLNTLELRGSSVNSIYDGFWLGGAVRGDYVPPTTVPEPSTYVLLGTGLAGVFAVARRRRA